MAREGGGGDAFGIGGLVALMVLIAIGAYVMYEVTGSLDTTADSYAENAIENVEDKGASVWSLAAILGIVIVAALIIGIVIRSLSGGR